MDERIIESLVRKGLHEDAYLMANVRDVLGADRTLDEPPATISLQTLRTDYKGGCYDTFLKQYEETAKKTVETGEVRIKGNVIKTEPAVLYTLKTLLSVGITRNEHLATACRKVFLDILTNSPAELDVNEMLSRLRVTDYYTAELVKSIAVSVGAPQSYISMLDRMFELDGEFHTWIGVPDLDKEEKLFHACHAHLLKVPTDNVAVAAKLVAPGIYKIQDGSKKILPTARSFFGLEGYCISEEYVQSVLRHD